MLISRSDVETILALALSSINAKARSKEEFVRRMKEKGFVTGEATAILSGINPIIQITDEILYLLVMICHYVVDDESIAYKLKPEKILTEKEMDVVAQLKVKRKNDSIYPIVIENVNFDMEDDYSAVFSIEKLTEYFDNRIIKYNSETQRPMISKWYNNQEIKEVFVNRKNVRAIEKNIIKGDQVPNYITMNILANGDEEFDYNPNKRALTIYSGEVDLLDGFHRTLAARNVFCKNPSIQYNFKIRLVHWDVFKAKAFIYQESLGTQIDILSRKSYMVYNEANQVVNKLNDHPKSVLRNQITIDKNKIINGESLIMFDVAFDVINNLFQIKDNKDVVKVGTHIRNVLGLIAEMQPEILSSTIDPSVFTSYMVIANDCYEFSDWEDYVMDVLENTNFDIIKQVPFKKVNKSFINEIQEYVIGSEVQR